MGLVRTYLQLMSDAFYRRALLEGAALLGISVTASYYATQYASERASNYVEDIILSNIPAFDLDFLFVYGTFAILIIISLLLVLWPNRLPFALKGLALFFLIRSVFVSLTHLGPYPIDPAPTPAPFFNSMFFAGDLFFSGHTGTPFLGALAFWHIPRLRYFFLGASVFFGTIVLLGHYHYSIDVLAAFFITYSIFNMALWLFPREWELFRKS